MELQNSSPKLESENSRVKWLGSPVSLYSGKLTDIRSKVPTFERQGFSLPGPEIGKKSLNTRFHTIVREPFGKDNSFVPIGVVSKNYSLVQHTEVIDIIIQALFSMGIPDPENLSTELRLTQFGERMSINIYFPEDYNFIPPDNHPMALRLECFNSVDGTTGFRALLGWYRYICSNGFFIGVNRLDLRRRHIGNVQLQKLQEVIRNGLVEAENDKKTFLQWQRTPISPKDIAWWFDTTLKEAWGFKMAARAFHIASCGFDGEIKGQYKGQTPTSIKMDSTLRIPGSPRHCYNLYILGQNLSWLAKEHQDMKNQLKLIDQIPSLLYTLIPILTKL